MELSRAREIALGAPDGRLGEPTKMPGFAFGLSAWQCQRGNELAKDPRSTCAHCYARSAYYLAGEVKTAHDRRRAGLDHPDWVSAMVTLIEHHTKRDDPYFRWHDSGDLQGVWHLVKIVRVVKLTPWVLHWLPTHEPEIVYNFEWEHGPFPVNLCVRVSADHIDQPPAADWIFRTSTVHRGHGNHRVVQVSEHRRDSIECKSYLRAKANSHGAGVCGSCRACWDSRVKNISYPMHGERKAKYQLPLFDRVGA